MQRPENQSGKITRPWTSLGWASHSSELPQLSVKQYFFYIYKVTVTSVDEQGLYITLYSLFQQSQL